MNQPPCPMALRLGFDHLRLEFSHTCTSFDVPFILSGCYICATFPLKYNLFPSLFVELNATTNAVYRGGVMFFPFFFSLFSFLFFSFFPARSVTVTKFEKPKMQGQLFKRSLAIV